MAADVASGVPREQAHQAALRAFGGIEQAKEACRDVRRVNIIEHTVQDLRFAARHFARAPVATATMIGIFALGIGFSTTLFLLVWSFVNGPVPGVQRQESLVRIRRRSRARQVLRSPRILVSRISGVRGTATLFGDVAAWTSSDIVFDVGGREANPQTRRDLRHRRLLPGFRSPLAAWVCPIDANDADPRQPLRRRDQRRAVERHFERSQDVIGRG